MFYAFTQNNSGGVFHEPAIRIIEADSADEANELALSYGIYGDRWYRVSEHDAAEQPEVYGKLVEDFIKSDHATRFGMTYVIHRRDEA